MDTTTLATRAVQLFVFACLAVVSVGIWLALQEGVEIAQGSHEILSPLAGTVGSPWVFVVILLVLSRGYLFTYYDRAARLAADETGYSVESVKHLRAGLMSTSGAKRAIVNGEMSREKIARRIEYALTGSESDVIRYEVDDTSEEDTSAQSEREVAEIETEDVDEDLTLRESIAVLKLDLLAGMRGQDVLWNALVPAAATFVISVVLLQLWLVWWMYVVLAALAAVVGVANYWRIRTTRRRNLEAYEQESGEIVWGDTAVLVKTVETDDIAVDVAWVFGHEYALPTARRDEFVEGVALRAEEDLHGEVQTPWIASKYARNLRAMYPVTLETYINAVELPEIYDLLIEYVECDRQGLVPVGALIESVIRHDVRFAGFPNLVEWRTGHGYDPELVRQAFDDLVPYALVEEPVELRLDEEKCEVIATRLRTDPLPEDIEEIAAEFDGRWRHYALREAEGDLLYDLPDVSYDDVPTIDPSV